MPTPIQNSRTTGGHRRPLNASAQARANAQVAADAERLAAGIHQDRTMTNAQRRFLGIGPDPYWQNYQDPNNPDNLIRGNITRDPDVRGQSIPKRRTSFQPDAPFQQSYDPPGTQTFGGQVFEAFKGMSEAPLAPTPPIQSVSQQRVDNLAATQRMNEARVQKWRLGQQQQQPASTAEPDTMQQGPGLISQPVEGPKIGDPGHVLATDFGFTPHEEGFWPTVDDDARAGAAGMVRMNMNNPDYVYGPDSPGTLWPGQHFWVHPGEFEAVDTLLKEPAPPNLLTEPYGDLLSTTVRDHPDFESTPGVFSSVAGDLGNIADQIGYKIDEHGTPQVGPPGSGLEGTFEVMQDRYGNLMFIEPGSLPNYQTISREGLDNARNAIDELPEGEAKDNLLGVVQSLYGPSIEELENFHSLQTVLTKAGIPASNLAGTDLTRGPLLPGGKASGDYDPNRSIPVTQEHLDAITKSMNELGIWGQGPVHEALFRGPDGLDVDLPLTEGITSRRFQPQTLAGYDRLDSSGQLRKWAELNVLPTVFSEADDPENIFGDPGLEGAGGFNLEEIPENLRDLLLSIQLGGLGGFGGGAGGGAGGGLSNEMLIALLSSMGSRGDREIEEDDRLLPANVQPMVSLPTS